MSDCDCEEIEATWDYLEAASEYYSAAVSLNQANLDSVNMSLMILIMDCVDCDCNCGGSGMPMASPADATDPANVPAKKVKGCTREKTHAKWVDLQTKLAASQEVADAKKKTMDDAKSKLDLIKAAKAQ